MNVGNITKHLKTNEMKYTDINDRLDLDNQIKEIAEVYPKNDDDFMFFIRGKSSTNEFFMSSVGESGTFSLALFNIAIQNEQIKSEILFTVKMLDEFLNEAKNVMETLKNK
jgi:hypothetical protein